VRAVLTFVILVAAAAPAFAQETQQDVAERIVREQEDLRRRQVEKVMEAPARAWDHSESDPYHPIGAFPPRAEAPPVAAPAAPKRPADRFPWLTFAILIPAVAFALLAFATLRKWSRE
jgi:hypothetical protein